MDIGLGPLSRLKRSEPGSKCLESFTDTAFRGQDIFYIFNDLISYNRPPVWVSAKFKPNVDQLIQKLETLIEKLNETTHDQTFAFRPDLQMRSLRAVAREVHLFKFIAAPKEFKFLRDGLNRIGPDTKSVLVFDYLFPFNNQNHDDNNCVKDLSGFYKAKGKFYWE